MIRRPIIDYNIDETWKDLKRGFTLSAESMKAVPR